MTKKQKNVKTNLVPPKTLGILQEPPGITSAEIACPIPAITKTFSRAITDK